ncbi:hypothetical protein N7537_004813 [Penicillium hordei]|uniref:Uncharacterized protein n=1 Tax=Penicillium hordei TaxID=40994 RepID=A0AAD6ECG6_9EURO|nr:uncharacterized protein N7537_004813 [Penicillium hordei]KAJ5608194.1 hypothetical protein N7537_004813 [Penicillium hordei]
MTVTRSQSENLTNQRSTQAQGNTEDSEINQKPIGSPFLKMFTELMAVAKWHLHVPWRIPRETMDYNT